MNTRWNISTSTAYILPVQGSILLILLYVCVLRLLVVFRGSVRRVVTAAWKLPVLSKSVSGFGTATATTSAYRGDDTCILAAFWGSVLRIRRTLFLVPGILLYLQQYVAVLAVVSAVSVCVFFTAVNRSSTRQHPSQPVSAPIFHS